MVGYLFDTDLPDQARCILSGRLAPAGYAYLLVHDGHATLASCLFTRPQDWRAAREATTDTFRQLVPEIRADLARGRPFAGYGTVFGTARLADEAGRDYATAARQAFQPLRHAAFANRLTFEALPAAAYGMLLRRRRGLTRHPRPPAVVDRPAPCQGYCRLGRHAAVSPGRSGRSYRPPPARHRRESGSGSMPLRPDHTCGAVVRQHRPARSPTWRGCRRQVAGQGGRSEQAAHRAGGRDRQRRPALGEQPGGRRQRSVSIDGRAVEVGDVLAEDLPGTSDPTRGRDPQPPVGGQHDDRPVPGRASAS